MNRIISVCTAIAAMTVFPSISTATPTPVTYVYNSGAFTPSIFLENSPNFGPNFTATFTFSDNFNPSALGTQCLYATVPGGGSSCNGKTPIATLLNYSITSGTYTLDQSNSYFVSAGSYPGLELSSITNSAGSHLELLFEAHGNDTALGLVIDGRSGVGGNDINQIVSNSPLGGRYIARNQGGDGSFTTKFGYTGPGGLPASGGGDSGGGTGGAGGGSGGGTGSGSGSTSVPEPTSIALLGLGLLSFAASRRRSAK